jgi:hypothetical protein
MSDTFEGLLQEKRADGDVLMQAARYYVAERCDDPSNEQMMDQMVAEAAEADAVRAELSKLSNDPVRLELAAKAILNWAWADPLERPRVERALDAAKQKLPVIEVAILAMVALYGMYLIATEGKKKVIEERDANGNLKKVTTEYYPHPLASVVDLFRGGNGGPKS